MNKKTLTALKGSIKKWEAIVEGTGIDEGTHDCPLCDLFFQTGSDCPGCPTNCKEDNSYYKNWTVHVNQHSLCEMDLLFRVKKIRCLTCVKLAQAELDHLKSLLQDEEKR